MYGYSMFIISGDSNIVNRYGRVQSDRILQVCRQGVEISKWGKVGNDMKH